MMKYLFTAVVVLSALLFSGCSNLPPAEIEATVSAVVVAVNSGYAAGAPLAASTPAPVSTEPPQPTPTLTPSATATPEPTEPPPPPPTDTPAPDGPAASDSGIIETELASGDIQYELPAEGFSMALPANWQVVDLEAESMAEIIEAVGEKNEALEGLFSTDYAKNLAASGIKFYALNLDEVFLLDMAPPTINVLKQELPFELTLDVYKGLSTSQLEQFFDLTSEIIEERVMLGDLETVKIVYSTNLVDLFGRPLELTNAQYLAIQGPYAYVITLSMPTDVAADNLESFSQIVETFRLIE